MSQCHTPTIYDYKTVEEQKSFLRKRAKAALKEYDNPLNEYLNPYVIVAYSIFVLSTLPSRI